MKNESPAFLLHVYYTDRIEKEKNKGEGDTRTQTRTDSKVIS
jgi:hypothetical protein